MVVYRKQRKSQFNKQDLNDPLVRWLTWFDKTSSPEILKEVVNMDSTIRTADERMSQVTISEEDMIAYDRYLIAECDRISAINSARRERDQYVLELIDQGLSTDEIKQRLSQTAKE